MSFSQTITTFLETIGGEELARILTPPINDEQVVVLQTLLEILLLVIQQPGASKALVGNIVTFCIDQVLPHFQIQGESELVATNVFCHSFFVVETLHLTHRGRSRPCHRGSIVLQNTVLLLVVSFRPHR